MSSESAATTSQQRSTIIASLSLYRPFIIGLLLVIAATYVFGLILADHAIVTTHRLMNAFMGFFFLIFALPKFINLPDFARTFTQYDLISRKLSFYAWAYPFVEFGLGIVLISNFLISSTAGAVIINAIIASITGLGMVGVTRALRQNKKLDCACLGSAFKFPLSKVTFAENGLMFVMALSMLITMHSMAPTMATAMQLRMPL